MGFWASAAVFVVCYFVIGMVVGSTTGVHVGLIVGCAGAGLATWGIRRWWATR